MADNDSKPDKMAAFLAVAKPIALILAAAIGGGVGGSSNAPSTADWQRLTAIEKRLDSLGADVAEIKFRFETSKADAGTR